MHVVKFSDFESMREKFQLSFIFDQINPFILFPKLPNQIQKKTSD